MQCYKLPDVTKALLNYEFIVFNWKEQKHEEEAEGTPAYVSLREDGGAD